jgi:hypothetical protein
MTGQSMSKMRRNLKRAGGKTARRAKPSKRQFITRAEARRRAERHVLNQMFKGATVCDGAEAGGNFYNVRREDTWVVYKNPRGSALRSADVVVICKRTGRVLYEGSADDEG